MLDDYSNGQHAGLRCPSLSSCNWLEGGLPRLR